MWIWYVDRSAGGNVAAIVRQARRAGVRTLLVKSSDGSVYWSQFRPRLVRALHAGGLHVCAWQYVYGTNPLTEAALGARAVRNGAECLVIDAEAEYEGHYASAQVYLRALRRMVGRRFPLALASFPFADYHPGFPYSVFLGPGGAQLNLPQMYWRDINGSVAGVFRHTYTDNRIYGRAILPLGQTYGTPNSSEVEQFRALTVRYRAPGISWWDFAWTSANNLWSAISGAFAGLGAVAPPGYPALRAGDRGDEVLWLQEHLARAYGSQPTSGLFGGRTAANLRAFQLRRGLRASGSADPATWRALLALAPVAVSWAGRAASARARPREAGPASASLHATAYEIPELGAQRVKPTGRRAEP